MRFARSGHRPTRYVCSLLVSTLLFPTLASAAAPETARPIAPATPIDELRLADGGLVRGTILERTADGDVTFLLATGEVRKYVKKDVAYAGPLGSGASLPTLPPPIPFVVPAARTLSGVVPGDAPVSFVADAPGILVHVRESSSTLTLGVPGSGQSPVQLDGTFYRSLCITPCSTMVPAGAHQFGLSNGANGLAPIAADVETTPGSRVAFHFESKELTRSVGKVLFWGGLGIGAVTMVAGAILAATAQNNVSTVDSATFQADQDDAHNRVTSGVTLALAGVAVGVGLAVIGLVVGRAKDEATLAPPPDPNAPAISPPASPPPSVRDRETSAGPQDNPPPAAGPLD